MTEKLTHEQDVARRFTGDIATHQLKVIREAGFYRHLRCQRPGTWCYGFDIVTWPGYLAITGDMGDAVFKRLDDMFEFFRTDRKHGRPDKTGLCINPGYWAEKIVAAPRSGVTEFDEEKFDRDIRERLQTWLRENAYRTTKDERSDLRDAVIDEVINADSDSNGMRKQAAAYDFSHRVNSQVGDFYFQDLFDSNFERYTFHFLWQCYAIAWAVKQYDEAKAAKEEAA